MIHAALLVLLAAGIDDPEEIYIARSLRESRSAPTEFCSPTRTGFARVEFEDRYTFRSVATRNSDGRVTDANVQQIGHLRGCIGATDSPLVVNFYAEGQLAGMTVTLAGDCRAPAADHPERARPSRRAPSRSVTSRRRTSAAT